jgi:hypothetical protein
MGYMGVCVEDPKYWCSRHVRCMVVGCAWPSGSLAGNFIFSVGSHLDKIVSVLLTNSLLMTVHAFRSLSGCLSTVKLPDL